MSPEAIQSLIDLFGVEKGLQILNLFAAPRDPQVFRPPNQCEPIGERPKELLEGIELPPKVSAD